VAVTDLRQLLLRPIDWIRARVSSPGRVEVGFPACVREAFPEEFPLAWSVTQEAVARTAQRDLSGLARHSPALQGYDWSGYLTCSVARMVRVLRALRRHTPAGGRVLDLGSYLGNFSVLCARAGFRVDARDSYARYGSVLEPAADWLRAEGVAVVDEDDPEAREPYDAVLLLGVLEHLPHTPRPLLEFVNASLRPGGTLILDTPNLAYLYNREKLARGESIFCPLELQYTTELPFEGHHREYTIAEVRFLLGVIGHQLLELETFNYSLLAQGRLEGHDAVAWRRMQEDASLREVILTVSRREAAPQA
jgi:2-polyprenyl-3-methyl-5-hydroxy-6-metoxy-1,4-benzoquinol methylase